MPDKPTTEELAKELEHIAIWSFSSRNRNRSALNCIAARLRVLEAENKRLRELIGSPFHGTWSDEVMVEAAHQRSRWGDEHDEGKNPLDWFWLIGFLAQKAAFAHWADDAVKARHHTVSTAAALANWAAHVSGESTVFRPGLGADALLVATLKDAANG